MSKSISLFFVTKIFIFGITDKSRRKKLMYSHGDGRKNRRADTVSQSDGNGLYLHFIPQAGFQEALMQTCAPFDKQRMMASFM